MARHSSRHSVGGRCGLPVLFPLFAESDYRCALPSRPWGRRGTFAPTPYASLAVPAGRVDGADYREPSDVHPGALLSPRRVVLFSDSVRAEVALGFSRIAG